MLLSCCCAAWKPGRCCRTRSHAKSRDRRGPSGSSCNPDRPGRHRHTCTCQVISGPRDQTTASDIDPDDDWLHTQTPYGRLLAVVAFVPRPSRILLGSWTSLPSNVTSGTFYSTLGSWQTPSLHVFNTAKEGQQPRGCSNNGVPPAKRQYGLVQF